MLFENDPEFATAPAQNVTVYVPIHAKLNPASLRISDFGFGSFNFSVPANTSIYTNRLDVRDSLGIFVDVTAGLDAANRRAFWIFQSIDPVTGLAATLPANSGFLPVNDSLIHNGEGYVTFTIIPSPQSQTQDTITAKASIIFDTEETIETNLWRNTIDAGLPVSKVNPLTASTSSTSIKIEWDGKDDLNGSGIKSYSLYVSEDESPFSLYEQGITGTSTVFKGKKNSTYCFFTIANDHVGNVEALKSSCEATITINGNPLPVTWLFVKGRQTSEGVRLDWATVMEYEAEKFVIQRSFDGLQFQEIGEVAAVGNSNQTNNYDFTDSEVMSLGLKTVYYRLMQLDLSGKQNASRILAIQLKQNFAEAQIAAYPNPFSNHITLEILNVVSTSERDQVEMFAINGKRVYKRKLKNISSSTVLLNDLPILPQGIYLLRTSIDGKLYTMKMIKE
ncbi:hypothetical protein GCM10011325_36880 [Dyadobacter sediminis]|nr:hypothetical protein GCM10011325_36880 [Dyadobacter sediminis]